MCVFDLLGYDGIVTISIVSMLSFKGKAKASLRWLNTHASGRYPGTFIRLSMRLWKAVHMCKIRCIRCTHCSHTGMKLLTHEGMCTQCSQTQTGAFKKEGALSSKHSVHRNTRLT